MNDFDFFILASENISMLIITILVGLLCSFIIAKYYLGYSIADPFHLIFTFSMGFGYGVVFFLMLNNLLTTLSYYIVFGYGVIFFLFYKFFINKINNTFFLEYWFKVIDIKRVKERKYGTYIILIYVILFLFLFFQRGSAVDVESRFEANAGLGIIVRFADFLRIIIACILADKFINSYVQKKYFNAASCIIYILIFLIFSSLLSGAKIAFIESVYIMFFYYFLSGKNIKINKVYLFITGIIFLSLSIYWIFYTLSQNLKIDYSFDTDASYFQGTSFLTEKLLLRVLAFGDMYFFALPNDVVNKIHIDNFIFRFLQPLVGSSTLNLIFNTRVNDMELGRQLMLYYYPADDVFRGPTNHFDLTAYVYFGKYFSIPFVIIIAYIMSIFHNGRKKIFEKSPITKYIYILLWVNALYIFLHPAVAVANLIVIIAFITFLNLLFRLVSER